MSSVAPLKKTGQTASDDQTTQAGIRGTVYVSYSRQLLLICCSNGRIAATHNNIHSIIYKHTGMTHITSVLGKTVPLTSVQKTLTFWIYLQTIPACGKLIFVSVENIVECN